MSRLRSRALSYPAALATALLLAACSGTGTGTPPAPGAPAALQSGHRSVQGAVAPNTPTELLYVVSPADLDAYDVSTDTPPTAPYFEIKNKKFGGAPSVAMSGTSLFATSAGQAAPIWSPAPTSKKSKATDTCAKVLSTSDATGATASSSALYALQSQGAINVVNFPFSGPKCPKKPNAVLQTGPYGAIVLFATQNNNLFYTDNALNLNEVPAGSTTPITIGNTGAVYFANMVVDSLGNVIALDSTTCNVYIFTTTSGALNLANTVSVPACNSSFDQGGLTIDASESRIFIGDYNSDQIDVLSYNAATLQASYAYSFPTANRSWSVAVSPVDSL